MSRTYRHDLDIDYIVAANQRGESFQEIANREANRLGFPVSRGAIAGIFRDVRAGKLRVTSFKPAEEKWVKTYVFGVEPDNGGLPLFTGAPEVVTDEPCVIISDLHIPYTDYEFAEKVYTAIHAINAKRIFIVGDLFHGEQKSPWRKLKGALFRATPLRQDLDIAQRYLEGMIDLGVEEIYITCGNHDEWLLLDFEGHLAFDDIISMFMSEKLRGRVIVSPYDRITIWHGGQRWTAVHQRDVSVYNLNIGNELAQKYQSNMIITHQHSTALGFDRFDRYVIVDIGGLHDPAKTAYLMQTRKTRVPTRSFCTLLGGMVSLWTKDPRLTAWDAIEALAR